MPVRRHPSLSQAYNIRTVLNMLLQRFRELQRDPNWFVLLWRLKPAHPPSRV